MDETPYSHKLLMVWLVFGILCIAYSILSNGAAEGPSSINVQLANDERIAEESLLDSKVRSIRLGMTVEAVFSILGFPDSTFCSFGREETFGNWIVDYGFDERDMLVVKTIRRK